MVQRQKLFLFQQFLLRNFFQNQFRIFSNMIKDKKKGQLRNCITNRSSAVESWVIATLKITSFTSVMLCCITNSQMQRIYAKQNPELLYCTKLSRPILVSRLHIKNVHKSRKDQNPKLQTLWKAFSNSISLNIEPRPMLNFYLPTCQKVNFTKQMEWAQR